MSYRAVKSHIRKDGSTAWRVLWREFKGTKEVARSIPETEFQQLGIHKRLTLEEANARLKQLNLHSEKIAREAKRNAIQTRLKAEDEIECSNLPKVFAEKFEKEHLVVKHLGNPTQLKKVQIHWRTAKRIIRSVDKPIETWSDYPEHFYAYFLEHEVSWNYVKKLLRIINAWGYYLAKQTKLVFQPIPAPSANWRSRIQDAYFDAGKDKASEPITPSQLESARSRLQSEHYNWLFVSVWLGLRPIEIDSLKDKKNWRLRSHDSGVFIFEVYQSKLKSIPRDERWKSIPIIFKEQEIALELIQSGEFKRPLAKTVANHFGQKTNTYGGRKGFVDLMKSYGESMDNISQWMGHHSIQTTMKHYKDRKQVHWTKKHFDKAS